MPPTSLMDKLVALCANRGFIYPSSEIYGGINGFWDYGPLGCEMRANIKAAWWQRMVRERDDVVGLDSSIIAHPQTWIASGHVANFHDPMVDCRECKRRFRADQIAGEICPQHSKRPLQQCDLTEPRAFNLMLSTRIGASEDSAVEAYLRPETCQSIFLDFKRVMQSSRQTPPFGIAQIGKAFRNEITPRNFIFRSREFEQMEMQFFVPPTDAMTWFEHFREYRMRWLHDVGIAPERLRWHEHETLAHYAKAAYDIEFEFPFGWQELEGVHNRSDHDLRSHSESSGKDLSYTNQETKERYLPWVVETSIGVDRCMLALLTNGYREEEVRGETRVVLAIAPSIAPIKAAVLPLSKQLIEPAEKISTALRKRFNIAFDVSGAIGRRYRRQDEVGTPYCITYDFESQQDQQVTVRERDSMEQSRIAIDAIPAYLAERISAC
jgi:glycyl-tRNA synthetase